MNFLKQALSITKMLTTEGEDNRDILNNPFWNSSNTCAL